MATGRASGRGEKGLSLPWAGREIEACLTSLLDQLHQSFGGPGWPSVSWEPLSPGEMSVKDFKDLGESLAYRQQEGLQPLLGLL